MAKQIQKIELNITAVPDGGTFKVTASADLTVGLEEYPDIPPMRQGMSVALTDTQTANIQDIMSNIVAPQAVEVIAATAQPLSVRKIVTG